MFNTKINNMLFKDLKSNYPVYILDKNNLKLTTGKVVSVSFPHMDVSSKPYTTQNNMVVDVTIESEGKSATYAIPENLEITYANNLVLATDKKNLSSEIEAMQNSAIQILSSVPHQEEIVEKSKKLLSELSPEFKEKQETERRLTELENNLSDIKTLLTSLNDKFKK